MSVKILTTLSMILITLITFEAYSESEFDKAKEYVNSFLQDQNNNTQVQSNDAKTQLTKLLKGMHGIEMSVFFKTNSAEVSRSGRKQIYNFAKVMMVYPDPMVRFRLTAHTDIRGTKAYNIELSKKRLESVQKVFENAMGRKYNPKRFYKGTYGEKFAAVYGAKKTDAEGMYLDRSVAITLFVQSSVKF